MVETRRMKSVVAPKSKAAPQKPTLTMNLKISSRE